MSKTIHRKKLFGGKSAKEVHAMYTWKPCEACGGPPVIQFKSMARISDLKVEAPEYLAAIEMDLRQRGDVGADGSVRVPYVPTTYGKMLVISKVTACRFHQKDSEIDAARGPSWVLVEIDRGPGEDKPLVQV